MNLYLKKRKFDEWLLVIVTISLGIAAIRFGVRENELIDLTLGCLIIINSICLICNVKYSNYSLIFIFLLFSVLIAYTAIVKETIFTIRPWFFIGTFLWFGYDSLKWRWREDLLSSSEIENEKFLNNYQKLSINEKIEICSGSKLIDTNGLLAKFSKLNEYNHYLGGENKYIGADCPNCNKKLLKLIEYDLDDPLINIGVDIKKLPLFYCWTCAVPDDDFVYKIKNEGVISILKYEKGSGFEEDFPYENYPEYFPEQSILLHKMSEDEQRSIVDYHLGSERAFYELNETELYSGSHQVGGYPFTFQGLHKNKCIECKEEMLFLSTVCDDAGSGRTFTDNCGVIVLFYICIKCKNILVNHECD